MSRELETRLRTHLQGHDHKNELLFVNRRGRPFSANKLREKQLHPLLVALGHCSRWIPFDEAWRAKFALGGRRDSSRCAEATPSLRCANHAGTLRARSRRCATRRSSESLDKAGELRAIVRKARFVRKWDRKPLKTIWFGRGGGDRTHDLRLKRPLLYH